MTTSAQSKPFDREKAIEQYTELMRLVSAGAYDEREPDGSYGKDGVERSISNLDYQAGAQGLKFVHQSNNVWTLSPMSEQEKGERYQALLGSAIDTAKERVAQDMPYVTVGEARPYQYHYDSDRWYVEVDVQHNDPEQGAAMVLCKVAYDPSTGFLQAHRINLATTG